MSAADRSRGAAASQARTQPAAAATGKAEPGSGKGAQRKGPGSRPAPPSERPSTGASAARSVTPGAAAGARQTGPGTVVSAPAEPARRPPRTARLVVNRVDPWSAMKLGFLLSLGLAIMGLVAVFLLWTAIDALGAFEAVSRTVADVTQGEAGGAFQLMDYVGLDRVMGAAAILACVNIVLVTALATLGAYLYNLAAALVGGLHLTLAEDA